MNIHRSGTFRIETTMATADGETLLLDTLDAQAIVIPSQCTAQGAPEGLTLTQVLVPVETPHRGLEVRLQVLGGELPAQTCVEGILSYVTAQP